MSKHAHQPRTLRSSQPPSGRTPPASCLMVAGALLVGTILVDQRPGQAEVEPSLSYAVVLEDRPRDDHGPGTFVYPSNQEYRRSSFDLRSVAIRRDGDALVFKVKFGADIWRPPDTRRTDAQRFELENAIYVQHVDIYIDHTPAAGFTDALPGRNIFIDKDSAWDAAVVLTPRPFLLRSLIRNWKPSSRVVVPANLRSYKNVVEARVPILSLGAEPEASWGYAVAVSGAVWENTFDAFDRLVGGPIQNALTMPVVTVAEPLAFGGGELAPIHPFVVDIIVPEGLSQEKILGDYDVKAKRLASIPAVYPDLEARKQAVLREEAKVAGVVRTIAPSSPSQASPEPTPAEKAPETRVREVDGELVVLELPSQSVNPFSIGSIVDADGDVVARVVVTSVYPKFILATVVDGADRIKAGAVVRFPRSP